MLIAGGLWAFVESRACTAVAAPRGDPQLIAPTPKHRYTRATKLYTRGGDPQLSAPTRKRRYTRATSKLSSTSALIQGLTSGNARLGEFMGVVLKKETIGQGWECNALVVDHLVSISRVSHVFCKKDAIAVRIAQNKTRRKNRQ